MGKGEQVAQTNVGFQVPSLAFQRNANTARLSARRDPSEL